MADITISSMTVAGTLTGNELLEVSQLSTTVKITASTLSALASDNSYNDSAAGFVTAGFAVGNRVKVAGFTGNVVNNILTGFVTALTTGKMTIGGTDGDVIVDDAAGETVVITKWNSRRTTLANIKTFSLDNVRLQIAASDLTTALVTGTLKAYLRAAQPFTLTGVRSSVAVVSSSGLVTVDIKKNGTTMLSTLLSIDASEKTSVTAATPAVISVSSVADDDEITIDITAAGTGAKGLMVTLIGTPA